MRELFNCEKYGLKINCLYEILATTISKDKLSKEISPNTSCMGIQFIENDILKLKPYRTTRTYKNLKQNGLITINFVKNVYFYAIAALKRENSPIGIEKFPLKNYAYKDIDIKNDETGDKLILVFPYIKSSWGCAFCKVIKEGELTVDDELGKAKVTEFTTRVLRFIQLKDSYSVVNRAENLALELIILTTRLKVAKETKNNFIYQKINEKYQDLKLNLLKFGHNKIALKTLEITDKYIKSL
ncbi:MAG: DUF447 family protein [Candidatus Lokiarchaeota archaeon]|nr:DUF447 family protein [Candidatus Lokiarchaeota archaeon]MBD3341145.1 DUF447 family protein [Candidatus Lokiarchaeota archaeon]